MSFLTALFTCSNRTRTVTRDDIPRTAHTEDLGDNTPSFLNDSIVEVDLEVFNLRLDRDKRLQDLLGFCISVRQL
jgi:hypothetical protein